jgi:hypothetical protein
MAKRKASSSSRKGSSSSTIDLLKSIHQGSSGPTLNPGAARDLNRLRVGAQKTSARALSFGSPSDKGNRSSSTTSNGTNWSRLLGSTSSRGISDLLSGGGLLTAGLDYLSGGIASLLGGVSQSESEPLTRFALPNTLDQNISVNGAQMTGTANAPGVYAQSVQLSQASKSAIVQTVKNAILTSSSLNDVIGEL